MKILTREGPHPWGIRESRRREHESFVNDQERREKYFRDNSESFRDELTGLGYKFEDGVPMAPLQNDMHEGLHETQTQDYIPRPRSQDDLSRIEDPFSHREGGRGLRSAERRSYSVRASSERRSPQHSRYQRRGQRRDMRGFVVKHPGLHRRTGSWCVCKGVWNPIIYIDPQTPTGPEHNFMIQHEVCHAQQRHAFWGLALLATIVLAPLYPRYRKWCEIRADRSAFNVFGQTTLEIYCRMRKHPTSRWGKFLYGETSEDRIIRTLKGR